MYNLFVTIVNFVTAFLESALHHGRGYFPSYTREEARAKFGTRPSAEVTSSSDFTRRENAALHPDTPSFTLALLVSGGSHPVIRMNVASNPFTPVYLLRHLASDNYYGTRRAVALNQSAPPLSRLRAAFQNALFGA